MIYLLISDKRVYNVQHVRDSRVKKSVRSLLKNFEGLEILVNSIRSLQNIFEGLEILVNSVKSLENIFEGLDIIC